MEIRGKGRVILSIFWAFMGFIAISSQSAFADDALYLQFSIQHPDGSIYAAYTGDTDEGKENTAQIAHYQRTPQGLKLVEITPIQLPSKKNLLQLIDILPSKTRGVWVLANDSIPGRDHEKELDLFIEAIANKVAPADHINKNPFNKAHNQLLLFKIENGKINHTTVLKKFGNNIDKGFFLTESDNGGVGYVYSHDNQFYLSQVTPEGKSDSAFNKGQPMYLGPDQFMAKNLTKSYKGKPTNLVRKENGTMAVGFRRSFNLNKGTYFWTARAHSTPLDSESSTLAAPPKILIGSDDPTHHSINDSLALSHDGKSVYVISRTEEGGGLYFWRWNLNEPTYDGNYQVRQLPWQIDDASTYRPHQIHLLPEGELLLAGNNGNDREMFRINSSGKPVDRIIIPNSVHTNCGDLYKELK